MGWTGNFRWKLERVRQALGGTVPHEQTCPLCGYFGIFWPMRQRSQAKCPKCKSLERHRLFCLWLKSNPVVDARILHFAPEKIIGSLLRTDNTYVSADIVEGRADKVLNIEALDEPDNSYDLIVCFHVLEHVDDARALLEMHRVLRPGGKLLLMFPLIEGWNQTYENAAIDTPTERDLHFGQFDHVRFYGADVRDRIQAAGFKLEEFTAVEPFVHRHGLTRGQKLFIATAESGG